MFTRRYERLHQLVNNRLKLYLREIKDMPECEKDNFSVKYHSRVRCREGLCVYQNVYMALETEHPVLDFNDLYEMSEKDFMTKYSALIER